MIDGEFCNQGKDTRKLSTNLSWIGVERHDHVVFKLIRARKGKSGVFYLSVQSMSTQSICSTDGWWQSTCTCTFGSVEHLHVTETIKTCFHSYTRRKQGTLVHFAREGKKNKVPWLRPFSGFPAGIKAYGNKVS
jgi:hypothetical protein